MAEIGATELAMYQQGLNDQQKLLFSIQYSLDKRDRGIVLVLSVFLGWLGVDRLIVGDLGLGLLKLFTGGVCGVMYVADWFLIMRRVDSKNRNRARDIAATLKATSG